MAIMTRWRMPPESWCGYSSSRRLGSAMRTRSSISRARSRAADHGTPIWRTTFSAICVPTVSTGLRLVIGSWKIIEMRWPRRLFISSSASVVSSSPSKRIEPCGDAAGLGRDQAQDGERRHRLAAARFAHDAQRLAARQVERHAVDGAHDAVEGVELRLEVADLEDGARRSSQAPRQARIEPVAQAVAQQVHRQHGDGEEGAGDQDGPRRDLEEGAALGDDVAPARHLQRHAGAQEAQSPASISMAEAQT